MARKGYGSLSDEELVRIHMRGVMKTTEWGNREFYGHDITPEFVAEVSSARGDMLTARAVGRDKLLSGGEGSHKLLSSSFAPSPKAVDRRFGEKLRENRGVERE